MELPVGQEGALNKATRGLAVGATTGVVPVTSGFTWKLPVNVALSPDLKSLMTTWILYTPSIPVGIHTNGWEVQVPALSVPALKSLARETGAPGAPTLNWNVRGLGLLSVAVTVQVTDVPSGCGGLTDGVTETIWTVACKRGDNNASSAVRHNKPFLGVLIEFSPANRVMSIP